MTDQSKAAAPGSAAAISEDVVLYGDQNGTDVSTVPSLSQEKPKFALLAFDDIKPGDEPGYIIKEILPRGGLVVVWGPPKCGKSFWTHDLVMHVALGWDYRGHRVQKGPVVYVAAEGGHGLRSRVEAWRREKMDAYEHFVPFWLLPSQLSLIDDWPDLANAIRDAVSVIPPAVIVIDTLNRTLVGSENSDEDMASYIRAADQLRERFGCTVIVVHHCGHEGTRPRGHTSLIGALDCQIAVKREADDAITTTVERMKDGPEGATTVSRLKIVELGTDEDGDPITSCIVVPAEDEVRETAPRLTPRERSALEQFDTALVDGGEKAPDPVHYPPGARVVRLDLWRERLFQAGVLDRQASNPRQPFHRLRNSLRDKGVLAEWNGLAWRVSHRHMSKDTCDGCDAPPPTSSDKVGAFAGVSGRTVEKAVQGTVNFRDWTPEG